MEWASETVVYNFQTQGIYSQPTEPCVQALHKGSGPLFAVADGSRRVKIFNYPALTAGASSKAFVGHSGSITNVRFVSEDSHIITTGADQSIFQWAVEVDEADDSGDEAEQEEAEPEAEEEEDGAPKLPLESDDEEDLVDGAALERDERLEPYINNDVKELLDRKGRATEEQKFRAVKAWQTEVQVGIFTISKNMWKKI